MELTREQKRASIQAKMSQVVLSCWRDPAFRDRLQTDPVAVLTESGIDVPEGIEYSFVFNTAEKAYFIIPAPPTAKGLSDHELTELTMCTEQLVLPSILC